MKKRLPVFGFTIDLDGNTVTSDLHEKGEGQEMRGAIDAIESMVLAHAVAGVDVESPAYLEGIETAVEAVSNHA